MDETSRRQSSLDAIDSPCVFVWDWARTFDEVAADKPEGQYIRPFPRKDYSWAYIRAWQAHNILLVPKSRRMLAPIGEGFRIADARD